MKLDEDRIDRISVQQYFSLVAFTYSSTRRLFLCFSAPEQRLETFRSAWPPFYTPPPPKTTASLRRDSSKLFHHPPTSEETENGDAKQRDRTTRYRSCDQRPKALYRL